MIAKKWIYLAVPVILLASYFGYTRLKSEKDELTFRYATIDKGNIIASVNATGAITPLSTVIVGSQMSGLVVEVLADFNTLVDKDQVLARLDQTQVRAKLDGLKADLAQSYAQKNVQLATIEKVKADGERIKAVLQDLVAQVARAEGQLLEAKHVFTRQNELNKGGYISSAAFETAKTALNTANSAFDSAKAQKASGDAQGLTNLADLQVATAQVTSIEAQIMQKSAQVRQVEVDLANTEIKSSVKGVVVQRQVELGQSVAASLQSPTLFLVAQDLTDMEILANVDEADVGKIKEGQRVTFSVNAYPAENFEGKVKLVRLGSQTIQNVVIYTTVISIKNVGQRLKPGMTATLRILTDEKNDILRLPNAALRFRPPTKDATPTLTSSPTLTLAPTAQRPAAGGGGGGGRALQEMIATLKTEIKATPSQSAAIDKILAGKRGEFAGIGQIEATQRQEKLREIRVSLFEEISSLLDAPQKEILATLRAASQERRQGAQGQQARVFIEKEGEASPQTIRIGISDGSFTELIGTSLKEGDKVIIGATVKNK